jgi:hypothetical protein
MTAPQTYTLFHLKFFDSLRKETNPRTGVFSREEEEWYHQQLARWCEQEDLTLMWEEARETGEQERRLYARRYVLTHLYYARQDQRLFEIQDEGSYGQAKERWDRTTRSYVQDLDLGRRAATRSRLSTQQAIRLLPTLWRYTLLRAHLCRQA